MKSKQPMKGKPFLAIIIAIAIVLIFFIALFFSGSTTDSPVHSGEGMMYRMDAGHTGCYDNVSGGQIPKGELKWTFETKGPFYLRFLQPGELRSISIPSVVDNRIFFTCTDSTLYVLDTFSGEQLWNFTTSECNLAAYPSPAVFNGMVYFVGDDNNFYALNAADGTIIWNATALKAQSSPAFFNNTVYVTNNRYLFAFNAATGEKLWEYNAFGDESKEFPGFLCSPAIADGFVYTGDTAESLIVAINSSTGDFKWNFSYEGQLLWSAPMASDGMIFFTSQNRISYDDSCYIFAVDAKSGDLVWKYQTRSWCSIPAISDGVVFVIDWKAIYALDSLTGSLLWERSPENGLYKGALIVADDVIYIGGDNGNFYILNQDDGTVLSDIMILESSDTLYTQVIYNNTLYLSDKSGRVYAVG